MNYSDTVQVGDTLVWHPPYSGEDVRVTFRGKHSGKFVVFMTYIHVEVNPSDCRYVGESREVSEKRRCL